MGFSTNPCRTTGSRLSGCANTVSMPHSTGTIIATMAGMRTNGERLGRMDFSTVQVLGCVVSPSIDRDFARIRVSPRVLAHPVPDST